MLYVAHAELITANGERFWLRWECDADTEHQAAELATGGLMARREPGDRIDRLEVSSALNTSTYQPEYPQPWKVKPISGVADEQLR